MQKYNMGKTDTIQSYVRGVFIASGRAERGGDIATPNGIFYNSVTDFFDTTVAEFVHPQLVHSKSSQDLHVMGNVPCK